MISNKGIICKSISFHLNKWAILNNLHYEWIKIDLFCVFCSDWGGPGEACVCHRTHLPGVLATSCTFSARCGLGGHVYGQSHFKSCLLSQQWAWLARLPPSSLPDELALVLVLVTGIWVMCLLGQDRKSLSDPGCRHHLTDAGLKLGMSEGQS